MESVTLLNTCSTEMMESAMGLQLLSLRSRHCTASWLLLCVLGLSSLVGSCVGTDCCYSKACWQNTQQRPVILVVGDSLSAEYGLKRGSGWVALLEKKLVAEKIKATVVNASISGDTTSGGRSRLPALLAQHQPTHVIIELGGNDALRGLPLSMTADNLGEMAASRAKSRRQGAAGGHAIAAQLRRRLRPAVCQHL